MQQEELSTSQPCGQGHSLQETGDQTDESLKAPGSWDTHKNHTWERSLAGRVFTGQSLPSSAKHRDSIPAAQADNSAQTKLHQRPLTGARVGDGLSLIVPGWEMLLCAGVLSAPCRESRAAGDKSPRFPPQDLPGSFGGWRLKESPSLYLPSSFPFPASPPPKTAGWEKVMH